MSDYSKIKFGKTRCQQVILLPSYVALQSLERVLSTPLKLIYMRVHYFIYRSESDPINAINEVEIVARSATNPNMVMDIF